MNKKLWLRSIFRLLLSLFLQNVTTGLPSQASAGAPTLTRQHVKQPSSALQSSSVIAVIETLDFTAIAAGQSHTCALTTGGGVKCWGFNWAGQLGDSTTTDRSTPVDVIGLSVGVTAIAAGFHHTCALIAGGGLKCWGLNGQGQLGDGTWTDSSTPVDVVGLTSGVTAVSAGGWHSCALTAGGGVKCWGDNAWGQLGDGTTTQHSTPVDVVGLSSGVTVIAAGGSQSCALTPGGGMKCWGDNRWGQLGDGTTTQRNTPVDVIGLSSGVTAITAGADHTCALVTGNGMKCWGSNGYGQLGDGTGGNPRSTPVDVIGLTSGVTAIAAGAYHTCALTPGSIVKCWGSNGWGQLGDGTVMQRNMPVDVIGLKSGVLAIAAGGGHTCSLVNGGSVKCWGYDGYGQLGDGITTQRSTPVDVVGLTSGMTAIAAGGGDTCVLTAVGRIKCWGDNGFGQLGDGTTTDHSTPLDVVGLPSGMTAIAAGGSHTCALTNNGGVKCWGGNWCGQLGDGTKDQRTTPVDVIGLTSDVIAITAGYLHTCALTEGGGVKCWGLNYYGQLGNGTTTGTNTPVDVDGLSNNVMAITAGDFHTCAITTGGGVMCWGNNVSGQLGDGTLDQRSTPVDVFELASGVTAITAGSSHTCALITSGLMKCWGDNSWGQLGDGTTDQRSTPVDVIGLSSVVTAITAGGEHTCALTEGGGMKCWGHNNQGQLGDGTWDQRSTPADVVGLTSGVTAIAETCALVGSGRVKCWGSDSSGQLGIGTFTMRLTPVNVIESSAPFVTINYSHGQPGSFFTITGWNFPPDTQATLSINSQVITTTLMINPTGSFIFFLDTTGVEPGGYIVLVSVNPSANTGFILADEAPLRPQEGGGLTFKVLDGIGYQNFLFLPLMKK